MHDEFIDLRGNNLSSDSFWPSFTDIMMVVVMIFLLTSTILMVRNWELVDKLRNSILAEQQASEIIRYTSQENATLEEQLVNAQNEISLLRLQLMQSSEQTNQLRETLEDKENQLIIIGSEKQQLENELSDSKQRIADLSSLMEQQKDDIDTLKANFGRQSEELKETRDKIIILSREKESQATALETLETRYGSLKVKYDKLIKPARTAKGKHVVEVQYKRINGKAQIRYRDTTDQTYKSLTREELHKTLAAAKEKYKKKLYIKMIIPTDSGLSYSEAWTFMKELLEKYDYYYQ